VLLEHWSRSDQARERITSLLGEDQVQSDANLDQLRHQAKDLVRAAREGDPTARRRMRAVASAQSLTAAQLAIARENGFASWPRLKAELERRNAKRRAVPSPLAEIAVEAWASADVDDVVHTEREVHHHQGRCLQCGANYQFETNVVRGFSDFIEAFCPRCGASIGTYREDIGVRIDVRVGPAEADEVDFDDDDWADDTDLPGFRGWTDQGTPIQEI
jgi:hypothetical protein